MALNNFWVHISAKQKTWLIRVKSVVFFLLTFLVHRETGESLELSPGLRYCLELFLRLGSAQMTKQLSMLHLIRFPIISNRLRYQGVSQSSKKLQKLKIEIIKLDHIFFSWLVALEN